MDLQTIPLGSALRDLDVPPEQFVLAVEILGQKVPGDFVQRVRSLLEKRDNAWQNGAPQVATADEALVTFLAAYLEQISPQADTGQCRKLAELLANPRA